MARSRIRVCHPVSSAGAIAFIGLLGGMTGVVSLFWIYSEVALWISHQSIRYFAVSYMPLISTSIQLVPPVLLLILSALWSARQPLSYKCVLIIASIFPVAAILMIFMTGYAAGIMIYVRHDGVAGLVPNWRAILILVCVSAIVFSAVRFAYRRLWATVVEQDGSICWSCGYPAGRAFAANCSECGTEFNVDRSIGLVTRFVNALAQRRRMIAIVAGTVSLALVAMAFWQQRPFYRFQVLFDPYANPAIVYMDARSVAAAATIDHEGSPYIVHLSRPSAFRHPVLKIYVGVSRQLADGRTAMFAHGEPRHQFSSDETHDLLWIWLRTNAMW